MKAEGIVDIFIFNDGPLKGVCSYLHDPLDLSKNSGVHTIKTGNGVYIPESVQENILFLKFLERED